MKKLKINLDDLIWALQDNNGINEYYLNRETGAVKVMEEDLFVDESVDFDDLEFDPEAAETDFEDTEKWLYIEPFSASEIFSVMEGFIASQKDLEIRKSLAASINKRHPFRNFKDALVHFPEVENAWYDHEAEYLHDQAVKWLKTREIELIE